MENTDLISRAAAVRALASSNGDYLDAMERIEKIPAVDAVPVVRCKDCKHWQKQPSDEKLGGFGICNNLGGGWDGNEYCSDGERKMDGETNEPDRH